MAAIAASRYGDNECAVAVVAAGDMFVVSVVEHQNDGGNNNINKGVHAVAVVVSLVDSEHSKRLQFLRRPVFLALSLHAQKPVFGITRSRYWQAPWLQPSVA